MKAEQSDRLAQALEDLAQAVEENTTELQAVREAIGELRDFGELKAVRDAIDDLRIEYEHAFRNGTCPYLAEASSPWRTRPALAPGAVPAMTRSDQIPDQTVAKPADASPSPREEEDGRVEESLDSVVCTYCGIDSPDSVETALEEGWTQIHPDRVAARKYLGICPECQERFLDEEQPEEPVEVQKILL